MNDSTNNVKQLQKKTGICNVLSSVLGLAGVDFVKKSVEMDEFTISHKNVFVPNLTGVWCNKKLQYRIYIHVAGTEWDKTKAGYTICTIGSKFAAAGLVTLYGFLHSHRANSKESS